MQAQSKKEGSIRLLRSIPYFAGLSGRELVAVASAKVERMLDAGQVAFLEGDPAAGLYLIVDGRAKIYRISADGREQILALLDPGDSCNEVPVVDGGSNPATFETLQATTVWIWSAEEMDRLRYEIPGLNATIINSLAGRCRELVDKVYELSFLPVTARLAGFLLQHAQSQLHLERARWTQEEMAAHIGTVREMVGRALRVLEKDGLIRFDRHRIEIVDQEGLESLL